ncbi:hypothetical protein [Mesorhizobium sp. CAU 1732]|uniref:hypothetical protein n=1 Tax=Mesorhizobium sp. CAU 1732 TaxID=3140358 RepID=UPI0032613FBB
MSTHRFSVGQPVRMRAAWGRTPSPAETFRVVATLPARDNSPQYRIRNEEERHERVTTEDTLEAIEAPASQAERLFR